MKKTGSFLPALVCAILFALFPPMGAAAQDGSGLAVSATPTFHLPLPGSASQQRFSFGAGASLGADYVPPGLSFLSLGGSVDYLYLPHASGSAFQFIGGAAEIGLRLRILPSLQASLWGGGGMGLGIFDSVNAPTPYAQGGIDLGLYLSPSFRLALRGIYDHYFAASGPVYQGIGASLSIGYNFSQANRKSKLEIRDIIIFPVFPVFYKYYNSNPLGSAKLRNGEDGPIEDVHVSVYIKQYMDAPKECAVIPRTTGRDRRGAAARPFQPFAFGRPRTHKGSGPDTRHLSLFRKDKRAFRSGRGHHQPQKRHDLGRRQKSLQFRHRQRSRRPAFFSKSVASLARSGGWKVLDLGLREAAGIFEAMKLYGLRYVIDPNTPHADYEKDTSAVDYLQFPGQTLEFRSGDCDDLSILTAALCEAAGVETAFITVPGHIFVAVALGVSPGQAGNFFSRPDDLIIQNGKLWLPIEVTAVQDGFIRAWQLGAREWRDSKALGQANFYETHASWKVYEPVAMLGEAQVTLPKPDDVLARFNAALTRFAESETAVRAAALKAEAASAKNDPRPLNRLGVLYGRYGLSDKAAIAFRDSNKVEENAAAWCNIGNLGLLRQDFVAALSAFKNAQRLSKNDPKALAGLVRSSYELDDRAGAARWLTALAAVDKKLADSLVYMTGGATTGVTTASRESNAADGAIGADWEE